MSFMTKYATKWFILAIVGARTAMGIFFSITGPTLPTLAENVHSSITTVSWVFAGRSVGFFIGAFAPYYLFRYADAMLTLTVSVISLGGLLIVVPTVKELWLLIVVILFSGLFAGYIDCGIQVILLRVWGPEKSKPLLQGFHCMFCLGTFLAPLIVAPFLEKSTAPEAPCPNTIAANLSSIVPVRAQQSFKHSGILCYEKCICRAHKIVIDPPGGSLFYAFLILAIVTLLFGILWIVLTIVRILDTVQTDHIETIDEREEEKFSRVWLFTVFVFIHFFCMITAELNYATYIYDYARCLPGLQLTPKDGSLLTAVFWGSMAAGRFCGIFISRVMTPELYSIIGTSVEVLTMGICLYTPFLTESSIFVISGIYGFGMSAKYSNGVSIVAARMNTHGLYMQIFYVSTILLPLANPTLLSYLMDQDLHFFIYSSLLMSTISLITIPMMTYSWDWIVRRDNHVEPG